MRQLAIALLFMAAATVAAQEPAEMSVDVQLRSRAEYRGGAVVPLRENDKATAFVNDRVRLGLQFERGNLSARVAAQHTGVWGQDPLTGSDGRVGVSEAWARMTFGDRFFAQLGRQQLVYDDERLLGSNDWDMAGNAHDALKVGYSEGNHQAHLILALSQNSETTRQTYYNATLGMPYKSMQTLWYHYDGKDTPVVPFDVSLLVMNLGYEMGSSTKQQSDVKHMVTLGTHFNVTPPLEGLKVAGSFYYQTGNSTAAWMAALRADYQIDDVWTAHAGIDHLSGDDALLDGKVYCFDPLFGSHHQFYGAMDIFYMPQFSLSDLYGLQDFQLGMKSTYLKWLPMQLTYHYFTTSAKIQGAILGLGHEVDYQLSYRLSGNVSLSGGYSFMVTKHTLDIVKGGDIKRWQDRGWLSVLVKM